MHVLWVFTGGCASKRRCELSCLAALLQRASESHRELAQQRLRHSDAVRTEMESVRGRLRTAEEDNAHKQALISHNNHQVRPKLPTSRRSSPTTTIR